MAIQIGVITALIGSATVFSVDGGKHDVQLGDKVYTCDLVVTGQVGALEIEFADGSVLDLSRDSQALLDTNVFNPQLSLPSLAHISANVDAIQQSVLAGDDPFDASVATIAAVNTGFLDSASLAQWQHHNADVSSAPEVLPNSILNDTSLEPLQIKHIEMIDIGAKGDDAVSLNIADVLDAAHAPNAVLAVKGEYGASLISADNWINTGGQQVFDGMHYNVFTAVSNGHVATLLVHPDINTDGLIS